MAEKPKIGAGHVSAMLRQGQKELAQILPAFPSHGIVPVEEPGLIGNLTPGEVMQGKEVENYDAVLNRNTERAAQSQGTVHERSVSR